jgi:Ca2+-binding RTX toxin-like protein
MQLVKHDLDFILTQIQISEAHTAGGNLLSMIGSNLLPYGLRTVDGTFNNITPGLELYGSADRPMPNVLPQIWRTADVASPLFGPASPVPTSYAQTSGFVFDSQPRTISNLISDQTTGNAAAVAVFEQGGSGTTSSDGTLFIQNVASDEGLSAPFNSWFTIFGQFFDHGLDLIGKGGKGTVVMMLQPDDPIFATHPEAAAAPFMMLTRAQYTVNAVTGERDYNNSTTPWIDQNQTYTSHPSHQVFLREYTLNAAGDPVSTGKLLDGAIEGSIGNWAEVKAQAANLLGIRLTDADIGNVPLLLTDEYGNFIPGANGFAQVMFANGVLVEGNPLAPVSVVGSLKTDHAFLDDIAHNAAPGTFDHDGNPATAPIAKTADTDTAVSTVVGAQPAGTYDNELLDLHFITGDGRGNENIGLTAVHSIFHSEHNRIADQVKAVAVADFNAALASGDAQQIVASITFLNQWLSVDITTPAAPLTVEALTWDGARIFQAARFTTEMQYQHFVFEGFARKVQPSIDLFSGYNSTVDPAIMSEFANVVYRFGHSMLTDTIDMVDTTTGVASDMRLIDAFLNPVAFTGASSTGTTHEDVGAIVTGLTRQTGNDIDEFITESLRNNLVGLPLDLAALNLARGRDTGIPGLNAARELFFNDTGLSILRPYDSWADFGMGIKHPESLVNFIAAYGSHSTITAATTMVDKRAAAQALIDGAQAGTNADAVDFMNGAGVYAAADASTLHGRGGLNDIDFWMGGLAEATQPFGGMLGSTFDYVFSTQLTALQNNDRLYYLSRTLGLNVLLQLEQGSMAELVMRNSSAKHLPGDVFSTPTYTFEAANLGTSGPILDDATTLYNESQLLTRAADGTIRYAGAEHVVMGGTSADNRLRAGAGDDTLYGDEGNDRLEGGAGNDFVLGGEGDDILTDSFGDDQLKGAGGNDVISNSSGLDLLFGGDGKDAIYGGVGDAETFAGEGDDFVSAGTGVNTVFGDSGNDWIEGGDGADLLQGDNGDPFQASTVIGHDVLIGDGNDDYDAESGDDIMFGTPGVNRAEGMLGFDWVTYARSTELVDADLGNSALLPPALDNLKDRFDNVEGLSGYNGNDLLRGINTVALNPVGHELDAAGVARISGLQELIGGATTFSGGNILIGGGGNDTIVSGIGNDVIDGDAWLNARISATSTTGVVTSHTSMATLAAGLLNGTINPGQMVIVREILQAASAGTADVAMFTGNLADYTITAIGNGTRMVTDNVGTNGTDMVRNVEILRFADQDFLVPVNAVATGAPVISDTTPTEGGVLTASTATIADTNGLGAFSFQWQASANNGATWTNVGTNSANFTPAQAEVGQLLRVTTSFTDGLGNFEARTSASTAVVGDLFTGTAGADNFVGTAGADNASGLAGADNLRGGQGNDTFDGGVGNDIVLLNGPRANFTVGAASAIDGSRVITDNVGTEGIDLVRNVETLRFITSFNPLTGAVLTFEDLSIAQIPATGAPVISDTTPTEGGVLTASTATIADANGLGAFSFQWQASANNGTTWTNVGTNSANFTPAQAEVGQLLRVTVSFTDGNGTLEALTSVPTAVVGDLFTGTAGVDNFVGTAGADNASGLAGADTFRGGLGNDTLDGGDGIDIALFTGPRANFTIGAASLIDGSRVITNNVGTEGIDLLRNIETLRFVTSVDPVTGAPLVFQDVAIAQVAATGAPVISDTTPTEGSALTATTTTIADGNGLGAFSFQWQASANNGTTWTNVGTNSANFTPAQAQMGQLLRVTTSFTDGNGTVETLTSAPTGVVGDLFTGTAGANTFAGTAGDDNASGLAGNDNLSGGLGNDTLNGGTGNDTLDGGAGIDNMDGGAGNDTFVVDNVGDVIVDSAGFDTVRTLLNSFVLAANLEDLVFTGTGASTGTGNAAANWLTGSIGNDTLFGLAGADRLTGGGGADTMTGGTGVDTFVLTQTADSLTTARDIITDFRAAGSGNDVINLTNIDANLIAAGSNPFTTLLAGNASSFTANAQLRFEVVGGNTVIHGNTDGVNSTAEFSLVLQGYTGQLALNNHVLG